MFSERTFKNELKTYRHGELQHIAMTLLDACYQVNFKVDSPLQ